MDVRAQADQQPRARHGDVWEVLALQADGHLTVHRIRANDRDQAEQAVTGALDRDARLLGSALAGMGLSSAR